MTIQRRKDPKLELHSSRSSTHWVPKEQMGSNELCKKQPCVSIRWHIILKIVLNLGKFFYSLVQRIHIKVRIQLNIVAPYYLPSSSCRIMGSLMVNEAHRVRNLQVRHAKEHRCAALRTWGWESSRVSTPGSIYSHRLQVHAVSQGWHTCSFCFSMHRQPRRPGHRLLHIIVKFQNTVWEKEPKSFQGGKSVTLKGPGIKCHFNSQQQQQKLENNEYNFCISINSTLESQLQLGEDLE